MAPLILAPAAISFCGLAQAQDVSGRPDDLKVGGDRISVGVGVASTPTYVGSDKSTVIPMAAVQGQVSGISFNTMGTAIYVDAVPSSGKPGWKLELGPLAALRLDRTSRIGDSAVRALGKLNTAVELGGSIGVQRTGVITSAYDTFSASLSYQYDVAKAHSSYVLSPEIDYDTPLSEHAFVSFSGSADYVGKGFGNYYYGIDDAGSLASGLPVYTGADKAGWKDWNVSMMVLHSLTGNLTHGLGIFATGGYQRLLGAYRRSPIVADVGSANQWSGAVGIAYTFR
ncbi:MULTISPECIES: MipA/OmpV family protein [unclassified Novosphingobium]|uniref:MipA/OmpV family protein n=1 Tax=unclassified Novosphingobium TaxID=2644732 RepID=UPI00135812DB|nr:MULTISPECIES: MipA/OmpV family protein [unclassified Novosphingobium]